MHFVAFRWVVIARLFNDGRSRSGAGNVDDLGARWWGLGDDSDNARMFAERSELRWRVL